MITSYTTLITAVADWLDRDDIDSGIETMVGLMESRLYRKLRIRFMESALSVAISNGVAAVPADFLEFKQAWLDTNPTQPLEPVSIATLYNHYPVRSADSRPLMVAIREGNFEFGPYPDADHTLSGTYYARPTALSTSNENNWLTANAPDVLLYGTLLHTAAYVGDDERLATWTSAYDRLLDELNDQERTQRYPSTQPLRQHVVR